MPSFLRNSTPDKDKFYLDYLGRLERKLADLSSEVSILKWKGEDEEKKRKQEVLDYLYSNQTPFPSLEIKPCPICDSKPKWWTIGPHLLVKCDNPDCLIYDAPGLIVSTWNERRSE